jgi:asparagine synthase (glutamine-hydrolysing)
VLLAAAAAWGLARALEASVGMFALALWDRRERTLSLARDRLGEKPLYYARMGTSVLFASEPQALWVHPDWVGEIDRGALALLMRHNYVPAPHSIFRNVQKLPPGCICVIGPERGEGAIHRYWSPPECGRDPFAGSAEEAVDELDRLLRAALSGQMLADVPLGAFLSGGIDSSAVVALMQATSPRPVQTFSIGFEDPDYDEAPHARAIAGHLGTEHHELVVTNSDMLAVVPRLAQIYAEPFADSSQIPTLLVAEMARQRVTVALSGDGGDELFAGYTRYRQIERLAGTAGRIPALLRRLPAAALRRLSAERIDSVIEKVAGRQAPSRVGDRLLKAAEAGGANGVAGLYRALVSLWHDPARLVVGGTEPDTAFAHVSEAGFRADPVRAAMSLDLATYLPDDILAKVDRAAMAASLETRVPLLDHRVVAFSARLPTDLAIRDGKTKWPLRQLLYRHVPRDLVERPKKGFAVPLEVWLRGPLREWAEALIDPVRLAREGFLDPGPIRRAWVEHQGGHRNLQYRLWTVLMWQSWLETNGARALRRPQP